MEENNITTWEDLDMDEYWGKWWRCTSCGSGNNIANSNYCSNCGRKFIIKENKNED